jgi:hypothetical protein
MFTERLDAVDHQFAPLQFMAHLLYGSALFWLFHVAP